MKRILAVLLVIALATCYLSAMAAAATNTMVLQGSVTEPLLVDADMLLDLNGYTVSGEITVTDGCVLTVKDSKTDDYTVNDDFGYGKLLNVTGEVVAADGYLQINEPDGISFHKVDLTLTSVTLRAENAGIYYGGKFFGDEVVAANVDSFGIALRLNTAPDAQYMRTSSAYSRYDSFAAGAAGNTVTGTVLNDVMKKGLPTAENKDRAQYKIYGSAYIRTTDGCYVFSESENYTFMKVVQLADGQWRKMTQVQKKAFGALYDRFKSIMEGWYLPNYNAEVNGDIDMPI